MKIKRRFSKSKVFFWCCALYLLGAALYSYFLYKPPSLPYEQKITFYGFVSAEPDIRMDGVRYIVEVYSPHGGVEGFRSQKTGVQETVAWAGKSDTAEAALPAGTKMHIKHTLYPRFSYGDVLVINCKIRKPEQIEDFRYDMYLARYGVSATCSNPDIEKISSKGGNMFMRAILLPKEKVAERISVLWHEPNASFMAGLLYGYRGGLGSLNELFSRTGVTHIVAISGYNITIISTIFLTVLSRLLVPRKKAFYIMVFGIVCFLVFAGLSASVVRAGIMGIVVLLARQLGRPSRITNVLMLSATVMTTINPHILLWDAGFQLSFISTMGLVFLSPKMEKLVSFVPETFSLRESANATLSAIIATLPLIMFQFHRVSIVAPVVNMLILWLIPWIMAMGFVAVSTSLLSKTIAEVCAYAANMGMEYIVSVVRFFAELSFASIDIVVPWWSALVMYFMLGYIMFSKRSIPQAGIR